MSLLSKHAAQPVVAELGPPPESPEPTDSSPPLLVEAPLPTVVSAAWELDDRGEFTAWQSAWWRETAAWFGRTLPRPDRAARSRTS